MRRIAALLLIAASGWLLYRTTEPFMGVSFAELSQHFLRQAGKLDFLMPAVGGVLGLVGGLIVFFDGVGGAALALIGGLLAAGFFLYVGESFFPSAGNVLDNEATVGLSILVLAAFAALLGRS